MPETFEKELPESTYPEIIRSNLSSVVRVPCHGMGRACMMRHGVAELLNITALCRKVKLHIKDPSHQCPSKI